MPNKPIDTIAGIKLKCPYSVETCPFSEKSNYIDCSLRPGFHEKATPTHLRADKHCDYDDMEHCPLLKWQHYAQNEVDANEAEMKEFEVIHVP